MIVDNLSAGVRLVLDQNEAALLAYLAGQVDEFLTANEAPTWLWKGKGSTGNPLLFPNAYPDDYSAAEEFSRYTRDDLVNRKREAAKSVLLATSGSKNAPVTENTSGSKKAFGSKNERIIIDLNQTQTWNWLTFLTDLRLILADRVQAGEAQVVFDWAGYLQGTLVEALEATEPSWETSVGTEESADNPNAIDSGHG